MDNAQNYLCRPFAPRWGAHPESDLKSELEQGEMRTHLLGPTKPLRNAPNTFAPPEDFEASGDAAQSSSNILQTSFAIVASTTTEVASAGCIIPRGEGDIIAYWINGWKDNVGASAVVFEEVVVAVQG